MDLSNVQINRLQDSASPSRPHLVDVLRTAWRLRAKNIQYGKNVILKKLTQVYICKTGLLSIGEYSLMHQGVALILTMPHPRLNIGKWVYMGRNSIIACKNEITIGDYTVFAPHCYVVDHEHGFSAADVILNQLSVLKSVNIGRDCYFGTGTIILGGSKIGDGAIIGANSVVKGEIPPYQIWAGSPARYIKDRT